MKSIGQKIRHSFNLAVVRCGYKDGKTMVFKDDGIQICKDIISQLEQRVVEWIAVEDGQIENMTELIVKLKNGDIKCAYHYNGEITTASYGSDPAEDNYLEIADITHWMPLPTI